MFYMCFFHVFFFCVAIFCRFCLRVPNLVVNCNKIISNGHFNASKRYRATNILQMVLYVSLVVWMFEGLNGLYLFLLALNKSY